MGNGEWVMGKNALPITFFPIPNSHVPNYQCPMPIAQSPMPHAQLPIPNFQIAPYSSYHKARTGPPEFVSVD
ncbi:hypothetical protein NIES4075_26620 [Tolypothrix sp. NIES-4075]|uniref:hypothetical protein n=1 Tax=Tolypothrix sp. NIES-4075 TaxID=2005459 RepID=UPI000B6F1004|nr:hypothetical protein [Tolypothrix sp. NIES-4075]GAX41665.1 hypothetical protein NIES4075_26620 [Tolypothrix sp. NIES-4075]